MSEGMVERVAEALAESRGMARAAPGSQPILPTLSSDTRGRLMSDARAAISAMREPTEEMSGTVYFKGDDISASAVWREMIDRALGQT
jgi:hypothetical protein